MAELDYQRNARFWDQVSRQNTSTPDLVAAQNGILTESVHRIYRARQVEFLGSVLADLPAPVDVLDLGCGPGVWAFELADRVRSWLGIDIAPAFVEHARQEAARRGLEHLEFRLGPLQDFHPERSYRLVLLGASLGYLNDADLSLLMERVRRHLEPGGVVYVRAATVPWPYPRYARHGRYQSHYRPRPQYEECFRRAGFQCVAQRDLAYSEATLSTIYAVVARLWGGTPEQAYRLAQRVSPLAFGLARRLLDLTPLPQSYHFLLTC